MTRSKAINRTKIIQMTKTKLEITKDGKGIHKPFQIASSIALTH